MAPKITESREINSYKIPDTTSLPREFDFTKINLFNPEDYLRAKLEYVKKYNEPIKAEIALYHEYIDESRATLYQLKRQLRRCDNETERAELEPQIREEKRNLWSLCSANIRKAFSLKRA